MPSALQSSHCIVPARDGIEEATVSAAAATLHHLHLLGFLVTVCDCSWRGGEARTGFGYGYGSEATGAAPGRRCFVP